MAEKTIVKPLSGDEIQTAVLEKLKQSMRMDCRLQGHVAYGSFEMKVRVDLKFKDMASQTESKTAHEVVVSQGDVEPDAFPLTVEFAEEAKPPNQVRTC